MQDIHYQVEDDLSPLEFREVLINSTIKRPVHDLERLEAMCKNANLIITARLNGKLIGVARSLSDFSFCTYLSDLAVDVNFQKQGIGKRLLIETKKNAPKATVFLLAAPEAIHYYPKIGLMLFEHCFILKDVHQIIL
jgi:N-acetylglutamate synthase-like GNAT family acetyltransferase